MKNNLGTSPLITASLSHYNAEKDKALAELDIYLNRPAGTGQANITNEVISLFKKLNDAQSVIELIQGIIAENQKEKMSIIEQLDNAKKNNKK